MAIKNIVSVLLSSFCAAALWAAVSPNAVAQSKSGAEVKVVNIKLDKAGAVKIAEIVLCHIYGDEVLLQKPWDIKESAESYVVKGRLPPNRVGGTATVEISKSTGQVLSYSHGK